MDLKPCKTCGVEKPRSEFYKHSGTRDGLRTSCKECQRPYFQRKHAEDRDRRLKMMRAWNAANPERKKELDARYRAENRERLREYFRVHFQENREKRLATIADWQRRNPEKFNESRRRRVQRYRQTPRYRLLLHERRTQKRNRDPEAEAWVSIILNDPCSYCGGPATEIDHIDPISLGGDSEWTNLSPACRGCNASKNARPLLRHLAA